VLFFGLFFVALPQKFFCRRSWLGTCLFIKVPRPGDSEVGTFSVFESNCHLFLPVYPLLGIGNPIKCLAQRHNNELAGLSAHNPSFMLNVKQGSCEYQLLKSFGLTRPGNRTQVYRLLTQK